MQLTPAQQARLNALNASAEHQLGQQALANARLQQSGGGGTGGVFGSSGGVFGEFPQISPYQAYSPPPIEVAPPQDTLSSLAAQPGYPAVNPLVQNDLRAPNHWFSNTFSSQPTSFGTWEGNGGGSGASPAGYQKAGSPSTGASPYLGYPAYGLGNNLGWGSPQGGSSWDPQGVVSRMMEGNGNSINPFLGAVNLLRVQNEINSLGQFRNPQAGLAMASVAGAEGAGGNPYAYNPSGATGLFQWMGDRLSGYHSAMGNNWSPESQAGYATREITGGRYPQVNALLNNPAASLQQMQSGLINHFEIPGGVAQPGAGVSQSGYGRGPGAQDMFQAQGYVRAMQNPQVQSWGGR